MSLEFSLVLNFPSSLFFLSFFTFFIYYEERERERERERTSGGGAEREEDRGPYVGSVLTAESPMRGSNL